MLAQYAPDAWHSFLNSPYPSPGLPDTHAQPPRGPSHYMPPPLSLNGTPTATATRPSYGYPAPPSPFQQPAGRGAIPFIYPPNPPNQSPLLNHSASSSRPPSPYHPVPPESPALAKSQKSNEDPTSPVISHSHSRHTSSGVPSPHVDSSSTTWNGSYFPGPPPAPPLGGTWGASNHWPPHPPSVPNRYPADATEGHQPATE